MAGKNKIFFVVRLTRVSESNDNWTADHINCTADHINCTADHINCTADHINFQIRCPANITSSELKSTVLISVNYFQLVINKS